MKRKISDLLKIACWIAVLCAFGCSVPGGVKSPPPDKPSVGIPTFSTIVTPALLPLTGTIAFIWGKSSSDNHVYVMNADGSEMIDITPQNLRFIDDLSWSPDGESIAFEAIKDGVIQIFKMKADGSGLVQLTSGEQHAYRPSWSPNGEYIMYETSDKDILDDSNFPASQIYLMKSDGSEPHRFTVDTRPDNASRNGFYRADGLISVSEPATKFARLNYVVNSDGIAQSQFPEFWTEAPFVWSPNGKFIAYAPDGRHPFNCLGLEIRKIDDNLRMCLKIDEILSGQTRGTDSPIFGVDVTAWSPDGAYILFSTSLEGSANIYAISPDGSGLVRLTNLPGSEWGAVWWSAP